MQSTIIPPSEFITMPWKNGLGETIELVVKQADKKDTNQGFLWRLSIASVTEDGGFSDFKGYQRILTLLEGNGITLRYDCLSEDVLRNPLQKAQFSGNARTHATLHQGPIKDFNVIARRDACAAKVNNFTHAHEQTLELDADKCFVYAHKAPAVIHMEGMESIELTTGHLLVLDDAKQTKLALTADAAVVVQISHHQGEIGR